MRPILNPKTHADGEEETAVDAHLSRSSALNLNTSLGGILQRRAKGYTQTADDDGSGEVGQEGVDGAKGKGGFGFVSQPALTTGGETRDGLRQRKSVSKPNSSLLDLDDEEGKEDAIPAIQVSRPAPS
uniref:Uncharacterized protein n=2 Tax=Kalmanozyma brasiliensis (strain GHG001) TaxID=1365824 RepID=V5EU52_KALBG